MTPSRVSGLLFSMLLAGPAGAQVTVNPGALDAPAPRSAPAVRTAPRPAPAPARPSAPAGPHNPPVAASQPAVRLSPVPPVSPAPPPVAVVPPPAVVVPLSRTVPPPPVPVNADAPGTASPIPAGGARITFGPDRQDLNPATVEAIRAYGDSVKDNPTAALNVLAYAAGTPDDPSTPRRLSLARALAVRAVLINEGLASTRIYVRALGANAGDGPADRVDVTPADAATPPTTPTAPAPAVAQGATRP